MAAPIRIHAFCCRVSIANPIKQCKRYLSFTVHRNSQPKDDTESRQTHFGYESIPEQDKEERVYEVFKKVAGSYDLMNDAMSMGVHRVWKDRFIDRLAPNPGTQLLDVAGGTGDIAFRFLKYTKSLERKHGNINTESSDDSDFDLTRDITPQAFGIPDHYADDQVLSSADSSSSSSDEEESLERASPKTHVTVCDINKEMLEVGKGRAREMGLVKGLSWVQGNAESLSFGDNLFDAYTIAFGIRNCTHVDKVVEEAYRVLKPGGRFMCLEFSQVTNPLLRSAYDNYSFQVIPVMGQVLARDWKSYQYLVESIRQFPDQEEFASIIRRSGFKMVTYENLTFGVAAIHSGFKL
ncbi:2-methoxy-6-polyprenyl-1,4-benzoquinol methylase, mitochondrial-like [Mizuhopecten yessoensis]|uniref:2-methoxy-6-polyprenyl-1,4-benzoquinol methylase, mitochondrial n=1 Tax=Mizuhopecten yessoensis TaxID=6573 RepID=A0A210PTI0_MIZYE|nr:2-methoxy-6-polyprenyl-1,4-benzoquinol methylase, mitochondrial-like [Mizuhopecten yessoensis]OWF39765.1 2-methoxy-6-polyprenyl-1,4-benzoquinol methylase, mitochondrial [Mizuhopecten yessoensis]